MLNKPTNISPYNDFIDTNNGLDLKFTLNNTVENIDINIYKNNGERVYNNARKNTSLIKEFSFSLSQSILENFNIVNNYDYYWNVRYWKEPSIDNIYENNNAIFWDKNSGIVSIIAPQVDYPASRLDGSSTLVHSATSDHDDSDSYINIATNAVGATFIREMYDACRSINIDINNGIDYFAYLGSLGVDKWIKITSISCVQISAERINLVLHYDIFFSKVDDGVLVAIDNDGSYRFPSLYSSKIGEFETYIGKYVKLKEIIYKIKSVTTSIKNNIPSADLYMTSPLCLSLYDYVEGDTSPIEIYNTVEYNEMLPAYFYCRGIPNISFNNISNNLPYIKTKATASNYLDITTYRYYIYKIENNDQTLLWISEEYNSIILSDDGIYSFADLEYYGITPSTTYKIEIIAYTNEGMKIEKEVSLTTTDFTANVIEDTNNVLSFNKDYGCVVLNLDFFVDTESTKLQIYRKNNYENIYEFVAIVDYSYNAIKFNNLYYKNTKIYDYNVVSGVEYTYYIFSIDNDAIKYLWSYSIKPEWQGVYITDVIQMNEYSYTPVVENSWLIDLNYGENEINRNYIISHPMGINQKYPKSVNSNSRYKTGIISGLLGNESCTTMDYKEDVLLIDAFDNLCANGNLKLLRSHVPGEHMIVAIDNMSSSVFGYIATSVKIDYTQIDETKSKQISIEV